MRINLIPMAGEGQRYVDAGYQIPKPFIEVDGLPMVIRACQALPKADRYIFVCRKSHLEKYPMEENPWECPTQVWDYDVWCIVPDTASTAPNATSKKPPQNPTPMALTNTRM